LPWDLDGAPSKHGNGNEVPLKVAQEALEVGERSLSRYGHRHSPKKYTQAQLFAILALKHFFRTDHRGIIAILEDSAELRGAPKLTGLPHYTTLSHASKRFEQRGAGKPSWRQPWNEPDVADSSGGGAGARSTPRASKPVM